MKTAILLGATGLVGEELLKLLLKSDEYSKVIIFVRKSTSINDAKLEEHTINFGEISVYKKYIQGNDFFNCLGTTLKKAGSKENFVKIDYDYPIEFARLAKENGINNFFTISSLGADSKSSNYYLKTKGLLEEKLKEFKFYSLNIFQPSVLIGKRKELRFGEKIAGIFLKLFSVFLVGKLKKYRAIKASQVANAMYKSALYKEQGIYIYKSDIIQEY